MKYIFALKLLLLMNFTLMGQSLFIDSLFSNNGFEIVSFDNQLSNIELFKSNQGDYRIVGLDLLEFGPPFIHIEDYFILGFDNCGKIDSNYATNGRFSLEDYLLIDYFSESPCFSNYLHIETYGSSSDGHILFSGTLPVEYPTNSLCLFSPLIAKVQPNGELDTNFIYQDISLFFDSLNISCKASYNYAELLNNEGLLCIGQFSDENEEGILIVKHQPNGNLDSTYNNVGFKKINIANLRFAELDIIKSSDDNYIIATTDFNYTYPIFIKIDAGGELVESFGINGVFTDTSTIVYGNSNRFIKIQGEKIIFVHGYSIDIDGYKTISLVRYNNNGTSDSTFGSNGKANVQVVQSSTPGKVIGIDILNSNKILLGYHQYWNGSYSSTLVLNENGLIDTTFATSGRLIHEVGDLSTAYGSAHEIIDGRLVLAGITNNSNVILSRFTEGNTIPNITIDGNILSSGITSNSIEIQWYINGELIESSNDNNIEITIPGEYVVVANDLIDCGSKSDTLNINTVNNSPKYLDDLTISPNPSNSDLYINSLKVSTDFIIYNLLGKIVKSGVVSSENNRINISCLANGIYLLRFDWAPARMIIKN